jgi:hypothetical protein
VLQIADPRTVLLLAKDTDPFLPPRTARPPNAPARVCTTVMQTSKRFERLAQALDQLPDVGGPLELKPLRKP